MAQSTQTERGLATYTVNGRMFGTDYDTALMYLRLNGGTMMEKLDRMTPAHVLMSDHSMS